MKVSKNVARVLTVLMVVFVLCSALSPVFADVPIPDNGDQNNDAATAAKL